MVKKEIKPEEKPIEDYVIRPRTLSEFAISEKNYIEFNEFLNDILIELRYSEKEIVIDLIESKIKLYKKVLTDFYIEEDAILHDMQNSQLTDRED